MASNKGYRTKPFSANRRMVAASLAVSREWHTIHSITEVDISQVRRRLREHFELTGEKLSLTAWVVACLARTVAEFPEFNSFRKGRRLILLDDVTISVLVERELQGEKVPEPAVIHAAQTKSYREIHDEIRAARQHSGEHLGSFAGTAWIRFIPPFLLRTFVRLASRNLRMARLYGKVAVTAVGMHGQGALWFLPLTSGTTTVTVGSIVERPVLVDGTLASREHLCLTLSFDHDIIDGAPAARFVKRFGEIMQESDPPAGDRQEK